MSINKLVLGLAVVGVLGWSDAALAVTAPPTT